MIIQTGVSCQWTTDSQRLVLDHFDIIYDSPSYIYHCALPLSPSSYWLHQHYSAEFSQGVKMVKDLSGGWGTCFRTVLFGDTTVLACYRDTIAVAVEVYGHPIVILNAITGGQLSTLSGDGDLITSLAFSPDGALLVSGGYDGTIELWDMQTGGVVKTFNGHTEHSTDCTSIASVSTSVDYTSIISVSISADCTLIASGSENSTVCLWEIQTGECHCIIEQQGFVQCVCFSPSVPQHFISTCGDKVKLWDINSHQTISTFDGACAAFFLDGARFAVCNGAVVEIRNSNSGELVTQSHVVNSSPWNSCFSPDGRLLAVYDGGTIYVWDITNSEAQLVETFIGHTSDIRSLEFSSSTSLISGSYDKSVKFWQISTSSTTLAVTDPRSTPLISAPIKSITLQAKDGITISSDSDGVVRVWDISTGHCKASFQTPSRGSHHRASQLIDGKLISVWCADEKICIWDAEKGELREVDGPRHEVKDLRISGDGSMFFCLDKKFIQVWSIQTGEVMGIKQHGLSLEGNYFLTVDGLRIWISFSSGGSTIRGWDFGISDLSTIELSNALPNGPHLNFIGGVRDSRFSLPGIEDTVTGKVVLQFPGRLAMPSDAQWDGQYLVAGYDSGEILILEYTHILS